MENRAGKYRTNLSGETAYRSFIPAPLPPVPPINMDNEMIALLVKANQQLSVLENVSGRIQNMDLFVSMYVRKEALMSSQIEGTQATLEDILDPNLSANINRDAADVVNYIKAVNFAIQRMQTLPLSNRLLRETHAVLMQGVRGQEKNPGEFRRSQNWIGGEGSTLKNARYIPPNPEDMSLALSDLEKYIHTDDSIDVLIQTALIHYQFETIHPFLDGNGRIGRLLITLFLMEKQVMTSPVLYISYFLKKNRIEYYDRMSEVRVKGNYEQWVRFFLEAVYECAKNAVETVDCLSHLHEINEGAIKQLGRSSKNILQIFHYLETNPIIEIKKTADILNLSFNTVSSGVKKLVDMNILVKFSDTKRNKLFYYKEYLDFLRTGTE